jgi:hypothetical protein
MDGEVVTFHRERAGPAQSDRLCSLSCHRSRGADRRAGQAAGASLNYSGLQQAAVETALTPGRSA